MTEENELAVQQGRKATHYRNAHLAMIGTGKGRAFPKLIVRQGCIVNVEGYFHYYSIWYNKGSLTKRRKMMDEYLEPLGLSISRTLDVETLHKEDIWEMYEVLRAAFIEVHEFNAQREFPKEGIECRLGECLAKIHGTALDHNKMRQDRERLKREYGEPASSKLRRLREYICSIAPDLMHDDPGAFSNW